MAKVYRVGSFYETVYVNTAKEADRCKPGGEEPESVVCVDAAGECNRLEREFEQIERQMWFIRRLLEDLRDACGVEITHNTEAGRRVNKFIADNPLPPATSSERDGQRCYGI